MRCLEVRLGFDSWRCVEIGLGFDSLRCLRVGLGIDISRSLDIICCLGCPDVCLPCVLFWASYKHFIYSRRDGHRIVILLLLSLSLSSWSSNVVFGVVVIVIDLRSPLLSMPLSLAMLRSREGLGCSL